MEVRSLVSPTQRTQGSRTIPTKLSVVREQSQEADSCTGSA